MVGLEACCESRDFPILAYDDPIAHLWIKNVHNEDHSGITRTVAKSRRKFWVLKARKIAKAVKRSCYTCRLLEKILAQQQMAPLPRARQVMSPTFQDISVDLIGPVEIRGTVNKRSRKKVWGLVITCLATRAVHLDVTDGKCPYNFTTIHRNPRKSPLHLLRQRHATESRCERVGIVGNREQDSVGFCTSRGPTSKRRHRVLGKVDQTYVTPRGW